jgi:hypothetical protein
MRAPAVAAFARCGTAFSCAPGRGSLGKKATNARKHSSKAPAIEQRSKALSRNQRGADDCMKNENLHAIMNRLQWQEQTVFRSIDSKENKKETQ